MKKIYLIFALAILFLGFVSPVEGLSCTELESQKLFVVGANLPEKIPFTNEAINLYFGEKIFGSLTIENKTITDFTCVGNGEATYVIYVQNESTINDFIESEDLVSTYKEKSDSGEIKVKGVTFGKKVKLFFVKLFINFV